MKVISTSNIVSVEGSAYTRTSVQNRHPTIPIGSFVGVRSKSLTGDGATAGAVVIDCGKAAAASRKRQRYYLFSWIGTREARGQYQWNSLFLITHHFSLSWRMRAGVIHYLIWTVIWWPLPIMSFSSMRIENLGMESSYCACSRITWVMVV